MMMGIYGMALGFLKLGFLLEFISLPILSGFISAVAIVIILGQIGSLLGEPAIGDGVATQIHDVFNQLPRANGYACAIGFGGIAFLTILDLLYRRWSKNRLFWFLSITRSFLCLVLFTGISYAVNNRAHDPSGYLFPLSQVKSSGIETPRIPPSDLISKVASRSIAVFVGAAVEHTAIARAFGQRNGYITDQSQELCYLGATNFFNSFFHAMGVGGAMSRTAINSACNVRSPLSGFVTTAVVLVSIYKLVGALYWIPKATLAAIIICAVWPLISPPIVFYRYWKASLADFISSMIAFWVSLFVNTSTGIAASVGFNIVYLVLRQVFARVSSVGGDEMSSRLMPGSTPPIPRDVRVFSFTDSVFFANAYAVRTAVLDAVQAHHAPAPASGTHGEEAERTWSVMAEQRLARLRRSVFRTTSHLSLPPIRLVVLDFSRVNHIDVTAVANLRDLVVELRNYGGDSVEVRFVGMSTYIVHRFQRMGWKIVKDSDDATATEEEVIQNQNGTVEAPIWLYRDIDTALVAPRRTSTALGNPELDLKIMDSELKGMDVQVLTA
jgi:sodium-independent sulfate anion transporter 11